MSELFLFSLLERFFIAQAVAAIPVSAFYQNATDNKVLRFCFAKKEKTLNEAVERILTFEKNFL